MAGDPSPNGNPLKDATAPQSARGPWRSAVGFFRVAHGVAPAHWMLYDAVAAWLAYRAARTLVLHGYAWAHLVVPDGSRIGLTGWWQLVAPLAAVVAGNVFGLYERRILLSRIHLFLTVAGVALALALTVALVQNLVLYQQIGRLILLSMTVAFALLAGLPRLLGHYAVRLYRARVMVVADAPAAAALATSLRLEEASYEFVGYCGDRRDEADPRAAGLKDLPRLCGEREADYLVVTRKYVDNPIVLECCFEVARTGCEVLHEGAFFEEFLEQVQPSGVDKGQFFQARIGRSTRSAMALKRGCDIVLSLAGIALVLALFAVVFPFLLAAWLVLRLPSPRPIFFKQWRCGQYGRPFLIYKLRTMRSDAEARGAQWAVDNDPRVTRLGRFLRKTRLDELPQLWNILKGDMSFVGPRPEVPELVREIERSVPYFSFRHWARPGLTGLAQIRFQYAATMADAQRKLGYDLYYIKNWSLFLDLRILLRTVSTFMKGAR